MIETKQNKKHGMYTNASVSIMMPSIRGLNKDYILCIWLFLNLALEPLQIWKEIRIIIKKKIEETNKQELLNNLTYLCYGYETRIGDNKSA